MMMQRPISLRIRSLKAVVLCLVLSACFGTDGTGYRDTTVPLSVTTRGGGNDMQGEWAVRAHYPGEETLISVNFLTQADRPPAIEFVHRNCDGNGDCEGVKQLWRAKPLGQNRWQIARPHGDVKRELWVIWVDEGFRTAAIGAPNGSYGWIIDRATRGGADRIRAAREILDFNGYDTSALLMR